MSAALTTSPQRVRSAAMKSAKAGPTRSEGTAPSVSSLARKSGLFSVAEVAAAILARTSSGMPFGPRMPYQAEAV